MSWNNYNFSNLSNCWDGRCNSQQNCCNTQPNCCNTQPNCCNTQPNCCNTQQNCGISPNWPAAYCNPGNSGNNFCNNLCSPPTTVCPNPCNPCPTIFYSASTGSLIPVLNGGQELVSGTTVILPGSTTVPSGTVYVVNIFNNLVSFQGGITVQNGFFTVPCAGQYLLTAVGCFEAATTNTTGDFRKLYIYKVDGTTGVVTLVAEESAVPISGSPTCLNISYIADLKANDRIFVAARQVNGGGAALNLLTNSRVAIKRLC